MSNWIAGLGKAVAGLVVLALVVVIIAVPFGAMSSGRGAAASPVANALAVPTVTVGEPAPKSPTASAVPPTASAEPYPGPATPPGAAPLTTAYAEPYPAPATPYVPTSVLTPLPRPTLTPTPPPLRPSASPVELSSLTSTYVARDVVIASWGTGPGQIGLAKLGGPPLGPKSFDVDSAGNIYILDSVNHRVNRYDSQGAFVSSFSFGATVYPFDMAVWKDSSVFFADEGDQTVKKFDQSGQLLLVYDLGKWPEEIYHVERIEIDKLGVLSVNAQYNGLGMTVVIAGTADRPASRQQILASRQAGFIFRGGYCTGSQFTPTSDGRAGSLELALAGGKRVRFEIPALMGATTGGLPKGLDGSGDYYLHIGSEVAGTSEIEVVILKYSPDARLLDFIRLPSYGPFAPPDRAFRVDDQGSFYELMTFEGGVRVRKWESMP